jgi:cytochrome c
LAAALSAFSVKWSAPAFAAADRQVDWDEQMLNLKLIYLAPLALILTHSNVLAQDAAAGEKVFVKCKVCHQIGENAKNAVGPILNGIIGRKSGSINGFAYSDAAKKFDHTWDEANLAEYLKNPKAKMPGNKMVFPGLPKEEDIQNVIAYLKTFSAEGKRTN